jgi:hypothetical protein
MAKPSQTFKKRQREHKLREKAQMKRERRQQRQNEKKAGLVSGSEVQDTQDVTQDDSFELAEPIEVGGTSNG